MVGGDTNTDTERSLSAGTTGSSYCLEDETSTRSKAELEIHMHGDSRKQSKTDTTNQYCLAGRQKGKW